jgi:ribosomal protein L37AE/L43A
VAMTSARVRSARLRLRRWRAMAYRPLALPAFFRYFPPTVAKAYIVSFPRRNDRQPSSESVHLRRTREKISVGDSMSRPVCPKCSSSFVRRARRDAFERLMSVFYIYPFKCRQCRHRFRSMQWRVNYTRIELDRIAEKKRRAKVVNDVEEDAHVL